MAKFKTYNYSQRVFLPVSLEDQLMPGTLEFAIHTLVETRLDTAVFTQKYQNDETGRAAYDPKILLKIVLLGYARGLISSEPVGILGGEGLRNPQGNEDYFSRSSREVGPTSTPGVRLMAGPVRVRVPAL
jgi:hypothetical protein